MMNKNTMKQMKNMKLGRTHPVKKKNKQMTMLLNEDLQEYKKLQEERQLRTY